MPQMLTRRTFIVAGFVGSATLAGAWWLHDRPRAYLSDATPPALPAEADDILRALIAPLLSGALPAGPEARAAVLTAVRAAIAGLPAASQRELGELFALLAWTPGRLAFAGLSTPWAQASVADAEAVLQRWRTSRFALRRSAYDALHQIVLGAWYALPQSWPAIGYEGPPVLA